MRAVLVVALSTMVCGGGGRVRLHACLDVWTWVWVCVHVPTLKELKL